MCYTKSAECNYRKKVKGERSVKQKYFSEERISNHSSIFANQVLCPEPHVCCVTYNAVFRYV